MSAGRASRFTNVGLFVDWNSRLREVPDEFDSQPSERARFALKQLGRRVTRELCSSDNSTIFRVRMRLYHGWTAGITPSANRLAISSLSEFYDPEGLFPSERVLCPGPVEFGDRLIDGLLKRQVTRLQIHLPNTLRRQHRDAPPVEKMVDAALAADLLSWARSEPDSLALVLSSDDDIIPPVFVAEAWMTPLGGKVKLLRSATRGDSRFLSLEGLLV